MLTETDVLTALRDCYDPVLPCNVVDLGLIRSIFIARDLEAPGANIPGVPQRHNIKLEIAPTQTDEASEAQLTGPIANRLAGLETVSRTEIILVHEPAWSPLSITPAGRKTLGLDGNPNLIQIR
jgi:metal-sulfur cluster biosynthetic enzyme